MLSDFVFSLSLVSRVCVCVCVCVCVFAFKTADASSLCKPPSVHSLLGTSPGDACLCETMFMRDYIHVLTITLYAQDPWTVNVSKMKNDKA